MKNRLPGFSKPQRGDVIVFQYPEDLKRDFIKRLVALSGETIEIRDGDLFINGKPIEDPPIRNLYYYNRGDFGQPNQPIQVPEGYYFVLGDNSSSSKDSRYWGFLSQDLVVGKAEIVYWPPKRIRLIK